MDLVDRLYRKVNEQPLRPKVLLVGTHAQGHQLLEQMCRRYGTIFNVEVQTLRSVVTASAQLELFHRQIRLLEDAQLYWVVRMLMKRMAESASACFIAETMLMPGTVDLVQRAVTELRLGGIRSEQVMTNQVMDPIKAGYLCRLLDKYEAYLQEHSVTDFAGLVRYLKPGSEDTIYLALEPNEWTWTERQMIEGLAGERLCMLEADVPFYHNKQFAANTFTLFRATGSTAEVREGLRRILAAPLSLDRTEILLSDYECYAPVLYAQAEAMGIACTLGGGLPIHFCASGRAAVGILEWMEEGYPVHKLTEMIRHGDMRISDERWSSGDWLRLLDESGIGWGRDRYRLMLQSERLDVRDREQGAVLLGHVEQWFYRLPDGTDWNPIDLLAWVFEFITQYTTMRTSDDATVAATLREMVHLNANSPAESVPHELAVRYVREMLGKVRIRVSATPQPGALHVSALHDGGWSGRDRTWIMGMDESAWGISAAQDPILPDEERAAISENMTLAAVRARRARGERESRLSLIRGEVWLSYSSFDIGEQKSRSPAFEMLQILRIQSRDESADFGALEEALGDPYGFMDVMHPAEARVSIDASDEWARALLGPEGTRTNGSRAIRQTYPDLAQGHHAQTLRLDERLSAYDGWLDLAAEGTDDTDGARSLGSVSVSQLEQYAACGLKFYFHHVLKLRPREIPEFDRTRWLQAHERGSLLHAVYQRYLESVTKGGLHSANHNRSRLSDVVEAVIEEYATAVPAPSPHVFAQECEEIRRDAEIFYRNEVRKTDQPCYFEFELTTHDGGPMEIELPGGIRIHLQGYVDRVDRIGPHEYRIIDYKTGNPSKYKPSEYFSGGTQLQHAIYSIAVEQWLRDTGIDPEARVVEAEYYFPTERGRGESIRRIQNRREELAMAIARLLQSRKRGIYLPTKDPSKCRYCDYAAVCGSHAEWMKVKREAACNRDVISSLLEVEEIG